MSIWCRHSRLYLPDVQNDIEETNTSSLPLCVCGGKEVVVVGGEQGHEGRGGSETHCRPLILFGVLF